MNRRSLLLSAAALRANLSAGPVPIQTRLDALSWVTGRWQGQMPWGMIEEIWSPAAEGVMMGMFRMSNRGKPSLYEFMTLEQEGEGVALKIRHFNGKFVAREEKDKYVDFKLTALATDAATFVADESNAVVTLVYRKTSAGLDVDFKKVPVSGKTEEVTFSYRRAA